MKTLTKIGYWLVGIVLFAGVISCSDKEMSDDEVIDNFIEYVDREGKANEIYILDGETDALTIGKHTNSASVENQIVVMAYNESAGHHFRDALLNEFFSDRDNRLLAALINKRLSLTIVVGGKELTYTEVFTPDNLADYKRSKK